MGPKRKPSYWAVLPATVRYDAKLPPNAKLLYAEISSLADASGYCFASNEYFASNFNLNTKSIQRLLKALADRKYIYVDVVRDPKTQEVLERRIFAGINPAGEIAPPSPQNCGDPSPQKSGDPSPQKSGDPSPQNCGVEQSNSFNNTPHTPQGGSGGDGTKKKKRKRNATTPQYKPEWFDRFWAKYPPRYGRKDHRKEAIAAWDKLQPSLELCHIMSAALEQKNWPRRWFDEDGRYIPLASTWINGRRWEVEYAEQPTKPPEEISPPPPSRQSHLIEVNGEKVVVFG